MAIPDFIRELRAHIGTMPLWLAGTTAVVLDGERVASFVEKPAEGGAGLVNAGTYVLRRAVLDAIPAGVHLGSLLLRRSQTGYARSYALTMLAGTAVLIGAAAVWLS